MRHIHLIMVTLVFNQFVDIFQGFLIGHLKENFRNKMEIDIFIYFKPISNRRLLLAIDKNNNSFTVLTSKYFHKDFQLIIDFNGLNYSVTSQSATDLVFDEEIFKINLQLSIGNNNVYELGSTRILLENIFNHTNPTSFDDLLNAYNFHQMIDKTIIFVGNIDNIQLNGAINILFEEIIGCIQGFYVNEYKTKFIQAGDYFYPYCSKRATESICEERNCRNRSIDYYTLCCSLSGINAGEHCYKIRTEQQKSSYRISAEDSNIRIAKFAWRPKLLENECLIQIVTKNNSLITIYKNPLGEILLVQQNRQSEIWYKKSLYKLQSNRTHILIVKFVDSISIIKISSGDFIKKFYFPLDASAGYVNVGWAHNNDTCEPIKSGFAFHYDRDHFIASIETNQEVIVVAYY